ncbi:MAG: hypothetical protein HY978_03440 [Candidatus Liptonbacteria bacterium]|nr:hypothetical protein [Candidatus Liptonbacteria bacterium]
MNRFGFIGSSGIIKKDKLFGAGLLVVKDVGDMVDKLAKNCQPAYSAVKTNKDKVVTALLKAGKQDEVIRILSGSKRFEMKFDNVRPTTELYYKRMIDIFLSDADNRFSAMIIDKEEPGFDESFIDDAWEAYTGYSASLVVREMRNLVADSLCLVVDEITKPHNKPLSLEDTFLSKLRTKISREQNLKFDNIFGALSIESHSNVLMQLTDVLLGAVMYDFKKKCGSVSSEMERKKEGLVDKVRNSLGVDTLAHDFTKHPPVYFSVFEAKWQTKKNNAQ